VVAKLGRLGRRRRLKGAPGRGTLAGEKPPVLGSGISQEQLPWYLACFEFAHNIRRRGKALFASLLTLLLAPCNPGRALIFIPFMTTGAGVELLGPWFGTGTDRGIALLFTLAGMVGLAVTLIAMRSRSYKVLAANYQEQEAEEGGVMQAALEGEA
jgi:hypothetical protein